MKGDFSRETFDRSKHYSGVLMQQGRVQVDADWNEQGAIDRYLFETEGTDVIGGCGAPIGNAGFQITTDGTMLFVGAGRFYADGIVVENDIDNLAYDDQAKVDLPGADLEAVLAAIAQQGRSLAIAYLDVWRRHITALDDDRLREVALGGPDTTTRIKTVWQVRLLPVAALGPDADTIGRLEQQATEINAKLEDTDQQLAAVDANIKQRRAELATATNPAQRAQLEQAIKQLSEQRQRAGQAREELAAILDETRAKLKDLRAVGRPDCSSSFPEWDQLFVAPGRLNARAQPGDPTDDPCELPPGAGYTRLENQLYRVEVHQPGNLGTATFKWSRDNGTVVTAIERISGSSVFVHDLGPDEVLGFANGQWVEVSDDASELNGLPGQLAKIVGVTAATNEIVLDPAPVALATGADGVDVALHPKLRRWDQQGPPAAPADSSGVTTSGSWLPLEDGVEVQFSDGPFATGDYWLVPARTATGDVEWPPFEVPNLNPVPQARRGIVHHYCRLALVEVNAGKLQILGDCRSLFPPLTAIQASAVPPAMHVVATSWDNDAGVDIQAFFKDGLRIRLDGPPAAGSVDNDSVLVTIDFPYVTAAGANVPSARERVILLGQTGIDPNDAQTIVWRWNPPAGGVSPVGATRLDVGFLATRAVANLPEYRVNVTVRGHVIWQQTANDLVHVDGQAFARPDTDPATGAVRAALTLPSGAGVRASDFESWFFLRAQARPSDALRITKVDLVRSFPGRPAEVVRSATDFPLDPDKPIQLGGNDVINRIRVEFSRDVQPQGEFAADAASPAHLEFTPRRGLTVNVVGALVVKGTTLDFQARDPELISTPGTYRFVVVSSTDGDNGIRAADDESALDGDFDGESGASFTLPFTMDG